MFYTPSFTLLYSRKGEMRGTQNEGLFSGPDFNGKRKCHNLIKLKEYMSLVVRKPVDLLDLGGRGIVLSVK